MKVQASLTPSESKRLIAKAVKEHEKVRNALKKGIIAIALGSTNAFVVEEILGKKIEKERYIAGIVDKGGACVVPAELRLPEIIIENGKVVDEKIEEIVKRMDDKDVFIKGANALDAKGVAGVMMASKVGGTIAKVLGIVKARGINLIIPVGLEKLVPSSVNEISNKIGIYKIDHSVGIPVGMMPFTGEIITEMEAFKILTDTEAIAIGSGGIGGAEGSKTFVIEGDKDNVRKAFEIVSEIKGEGKIKSLRGNCSDCFYDYCPSNLRGRR